MTTMETSPSRIINIEALSFTSGAHLLLKRALRDLPAGARLGVRASAPDFAVHLRGWRREQGHEYIEGDDRFAAWVVRGASAHGRWRQAERAGQANLREHDAVRAAPSADWGFAARGALIETGGPAFHYALQRKEQVWAENVQKLYAQALAAQWNPQTAINWEEPFAPGDMAITRRHEALSQTAGLNEEVFDALILLAAGSWRPEDIAAGYARAQTLKDEMHAGRKARLEKLGFSSVEAAELSTLHTRNFM